MPRRKTAKPHRNAVPRWTPANVKLLRSLAGRKSVKAIARELKRSEAAVRFKAHTAGVSLAMK